MKVKLLIIFIFLSAIIIGGYYLGGFDKPVSAVDPFTQPTTYHVCGDGRSMEPTLKDKECHRLIKIVKPKENDIVSIICDKCISANNKGKIKGVIKRLIKINDQDCWWLDGDHKGSWIENGISVHSYDSDDYGWVCPNERKFEGVVKVN